MKVKSLLNKLGGNFIVRIYDHDYATNNVRGDLMTTNEAKVQYGDRKIRQIMNGIYETEVKNNCLVLYLKEPEEKRHYKKQAHKATRTIKEHISGGCELVSREVKIYKNHKIWYTEAVSGTYYKISYNGAPLGGKYKSVEEAIRYIDSVEAIVEDIAIIEEKAKEQQEEENENCNATKQ